MSDDTARSALDTLLQGILPEHGCAYVAGPLAHSREYYHCAAAGVAVPSDLRARNQSALTTFARALRSRLSVPVIDPGTLMVPSWTDRQIGDFFLDVITTYVVQAWFLDEWAYSRGATKEFVLCSRLGIMTVDREGNALSRDQGCDLIRDSVADVRRYGGDTSALESRLVELLGASTDRGGP